MIKIEDAHLGDGVYASFDGYAISLDLRAQPPTPNNKIVLEPQTMAALDDFRDYIKKAFAAENPAAEKEEADHQNILFRTERGK